MRLRSSVWLISWLLAGVWFLLILVWMLPYIRGQHASSADIESFPTYRAAKRAATGEFKPPYSHINSITRIGDESLSPIVFARYEYVIEPDRARTALTFQPRGGRLQVRYDRLTGALVALAGLVLLGYFFRAGRKLPPLEGSNTGDKLRVSSTISSPALPESKEHLQSILLQEIERGDNLCGRLSLRSNLLLWLGALVAFSGIGAIYFLFPWDVADPQKEVLLLVRAFTIVASIEAFALLLLKQYRASQDDFAYYNGLRTRNLHFLSVLLALQSEHADTKNWFTAALLAEDPMQGRQRRPVKGGAAAREQGPDATKDGTAEDAPLHASLLPLLKELRSKPKSGDAG